MVIMCNAPIRQTRLRYSIDVPTDDFARVIEILLGCRATALKIHKLMSGFNIEFCQGEHDTPKVIDELERFQMLKTIPKD